jgi:hypothetical protein
MLERLYLLNLLSGQWLQSETAALVTQYLPRLTSDAQTAKPYLE